MFKELLLKRTALLGCMLITVSLSTSCRKEGKCDIHKQPSNRHVSVVIDGNCYEDCFPGLIYSSNTTSYYVDENRLDIGADFFCTDETIEDFSIVISIQNPNQGIVGQHELASQQSNIYAFLHQPTSAEIFMTDQDHFGTLTIDSYDEEDYVINGSFHFMAYNEGLDSTLNIEEGLISNIQVNPY